MHKKAWMVGLALVAVMSSVEAASDKEARYELLEAEARIQQLEKQREYGTRIKISNTYLRDDWDKSGYGNAKLEWILAFMQVEKQERSNKRLKQLVDFYFPVFNDTIFAAIDKSGRRKELMNKVATSVGLRAVEYVSEDIYYYTYENGNTGRYRKENK